MNSAAVLLLDTKLKGWMWSPHALPVLTLQLRASVLSASSEMWNQSLSVVPFYRTTGPPRGMAASLSATACSLLLVQSGAEGSLSDLCYHSKWTWYMRRLVLCSNKEASTVIVWRQSVYSQRCIEKLKYYIRQSNASQRKDKETLSLRWESQWCNNRLNHNLQQTPSKVCPSSHG